MAISSPESPAPETLEDNERRTFACFTKDGQFVNTFGLPEDYAGRETFNDARRRGFVVFPARRHTLELQESNDNQPTIYDLIDQLDDLESGEVTGFTLKDIVN